MSVGRLTHHGTIRLGRYAPPLSQWVPAVKQRLWKSMGITLGRELGEQVAEAVAAERIPPPEVVVSIPIHWTRRLLRGIDHSAMLAEEIARIVGVSRSTPLKATIALRQTGSSRDARVGNSDRFLPTRAAAEISGKHVLLVDDVRTTGSTSRAAARALLACGARSMTLAVCAVVDPPRRNSIHASEPLRNVGKF